MRKKESIPRLKEATLLMQNPYQFDFTERASYSIAAVLLTEIIAEAIDLQISFQITVMDASKAFDLLYHKGLLNIIHDMGVGGALTVRSTYMY